MSDLVMDPKQVRVDLAAVMESHGFTGGPLWWTRIGPHGERQAIRTVLWGLGSKPRPHIVVEWIGDLTEDEIRRREAMSPDELLAHLTLVKIPLTQPWSDVVDEFETTVLPALEPENT